jgi:hypothetical protein
MRPDDPDPTGMPMPADRYAELVQRRERQAARDPLQPVPSRQGVAATSALAAELLGEAAQRPLESGELLLVSEEATVADLEAAAATIAAADGWPEPDPDEPLLADLAAPRLLCPRVFEIANWQPSLAQHLKMVHGALRAGQDVGQTMLVGHVETLPERVEHLGRLKELRDAAARTGQGGGRLVVAVRLAGDADLPGGTAAGAIVAEARPCDPRDDLRHAVAIARLALGDGGVLVQETA